MAKRSDVIRALVASLVISVIFGIGAAGIELVAHGLASFAFVWVLKVVLGIVTVFAGAEAYCRGCKERK